MSEHPLPTRQCSIFEKPDDIWLAGERGAQFSINLGSGSPVRAERLQRRLGLVRQRGDYLQMSQ